MKRNILCLGPKARVLKIRASTFAAHLRRCSTLQTQLRSAGLPDTVPVAHWFQLSDAPEGKRVSLLGWVPKSLTEGRGSHYRGQERETEGLRG